MPTSLSRRDFVAGCLAAAALSRVSRRASALANPATAPDAFPFYAMDTGLRGPDVPTPEDKVRLLHDLGYWGIDYTLNHDELPRMLELLDKYHVQLACVYLSPAMEDPPDPRLAESLKRMKGRSTRIELAIRSTRFKPSDSTGDGQALELIRRVSDMAADTGPVVSLYPHTGQWVERVEDGVRLAGKSGRKNVGTNFNLVHWKWVRQTKPLKQILHEALPSLFAISINGLDGNTIVPLDQGNYDVAAFIGLVKQIGYHGPIGLQGYGVPGPSGPNLKRSIQKWRQIVGSLKG